MSRSKRRPYYHIACCGRKEIRWAKRKVNRRFRSWIKHQEEIGQYAWYKKREHSWQWHPGDGRVWGGDPFYNIWAHTIEPPNPRWKRK